MLIGLLNISESLNCLVVVSNALVFHQYSPPTAFEMYFQFIKDHHRNISFSMIDTGDSIVLVGKRMSWF